MCSRSLIQAAKHSSILDAVSMGAANAQVCVEESPDAVLHHSIQACKPSSAIGHVGLAGPNLFDTTKERTTEDVLSSILTDNGVMIRPAGL